MSLLLLRADIQADLLKQDYASLTDEDLTATLNAKTRFRLRPLNSTELLTWASANQRKLKLQAAAAAHISPDVQNIADTLATMLNRDNVTLNLNLPEHVDLIDALVAGGVLKDDDKAALVTLATEPISRLTELGIGEMHLGDVQWARQTGPWTLKT